MKTYQNKRTIVKAKIAGKVVVINFASDKRDAYKEMKDTIEYLGMGTYHSYDGVPADDTKFTHFWRHNNQLVHIKKLIAELNYDSKESLVRWIMSETGRERQYSECRCTFRSRAYTKDGESICGNCDKPI